MHLPISARRSTSVNRSGERPIHRRASGWEVAVMIDPEAFYQK